MTLRKMTATDWSEVSIIYGEGIATGMATFETQVPSFETWNGSHLDIGRLVALHEERIAGWAALSAVSSRCVYQGVAEVSVYIGKLYRGMGFGKQLMKQLIKVSEDAGFWTLQSGIFPENNASVALINKWVSAIWGVAKKLPGIKGNGKIT